MSTVEYKENDNDASNESDIEIVEKQIPTVEIASDNSVTSVSDNVVPSSSCNETTNTASENQAAESDTEVSPISNIEIDIPTNAENAINSEAETTQSDDWDEEMETKVDSLLRNIRVKSDVISARKRGAMNMDGPFHIDITAIPVHLYQEALLRNIWNPAKVAFDICYLSRWSLPEYHAIEYIPTEGFLCSVTVNDQEFLCKYPGKTPISSKDMAAARFLQFLGFRVNFQELKLFCDWTHIEDPSTSERREREEIDLIMKINHLTNFALWRSRYYYRQERRGKDFPAELKRMKSLLLMENIYETLRNRKGTSCPQGETLGTFEENASRKRRRDSSNAKKLTSVVKRAKNDTESGSSNSDTDLRNKIKTKRTEENTL